MDKSTLKTAPNPYFKIGLCGSHRTGKTTLAEHLSLKLTIPFLKTRTSEVFRQKGLNPSEKMDFKTRIQIQQSIISDAESIWTSADGSFITDRTPLDMMAYLLGDIQGSTEADFRELSVYLEKGFQICNRVFTHLVVIQPAIPLVYETGKAALNPSYMEHLNLIMMGLCLDDRFRRPFRIIKRHILSIPERVSAILDMLE